MTRHTARRGAGRAQRAAEPPPLPAGPRDFTWPSPHQLVDPRAPWLLPALAVLVTRLALGWYIPFAAEDAYITFRYARHFAHGFGLVFNPGERVFGFSSPLWTLWLGAGFAVGAPPVVWARVTSLAAELATLLVVVALLRRYASNASAWCFAFFFAVWPYFSAVSVSGMESTLMLALIALAAAAAGRRSRWTGPALAALALTRPEGIAAAAVLLLGASWRDRMVAVSLTSAALAALVLYFGNAIPQSLVAKSLLYGTPGPWAARYWWDWLSPFVPGGFTTVTETGHLFLLSIVFAPAAAFGVRELWRERTSPLATTIAACLVVWLGYALLGVAYFWWYLLVPVAGLAALAAAGFPRLTRGPALYVSCGLLVASLWTVAPQLYVGRAEAEYFGFARVAEYLAANATPGDKVMLEPIGLIGYRAPLVVVDEVGLVSPPVARRRLEGAGWYTDTVSRERPQWLVVRRGVLTGGQAFAGVGAPFRNLAERDSLLARFAEVSVADSAAGPAALVVLRRLR